MGFLLLAAASLQLVWQAQALRSGIFYRDRCTPATADVERLRARAWPRQDAAPAPKISRIVYINLDSDRPRREFMENQFVKLKGNGTDFQWQRLAAVEKEAMRSDERYSAWRDKGFNPTKYPGVQGMMGQAACTFSHREAIRSLVGPEEQRLEASNELAMIVEDDVQIDPDFVHSWEKLWPFLPEDWDIVHVGGFGPRDCRQQVNVHLDRAGWSDAPPQGPCRYCGTQAYIVRPGRASIVQHRLDASKIFHTDALLDAATPPFEDPEKVPELRSYYAFPLLAGHATGADGGDIFG
eukprot:CAMPEP_0170610156 /NCGR_PEP_ID=MMETSP0224-20130122/22503_1 /TAXON_ID=285029 /ORGANISM="Togula jolla, Strain CCCM 725" /LENGTH=294 /DNA_ID=CAMNT_0010935501 /DNA_START=39 /DNA_END=920 /DNA_ORIENTATION=-